MAKLVSLLEGRQHHHGIFAVKNYTSTKSSLLESFKKLSCDKHYKLYKVLKLLKHFRRSVFLANILNQNNTHVKNFEIGQNTYGGYVIITSAR